MLMRTTLNKHLKKKYNLLGNKIKMQVILWLIYGLFFL